MAFTSNSSPVFIFKNGTILSRQLLSDIIKAQISKININNTCYSSHSLRIEGACDAFKRGWDIATIKLFGRWKSDSVLLYIRLEMNNILTALKKLEHSKQKT